MVPFISMYIENLCGQIHIKVLHLQEIFIKMNIKFKYFCIHKLRNFYVDLVIKKSSLFVTQIIVFMYHHHIKILIKINHQYYNYK